LDFVEDPDMAGHDCELCTEFAGRVDAEYNVVGMCLLSAMECGLELCLDFLPGENGYEPTNYQRRCLARAFHTGAPADDDDMEACFGYPTGSVQQRLCIQVANGETADTSCVLSSQYRTPLSSTRTIT